VTVSGWMRWGLNWKLDFFEESCQLGFENLMSIMNIREKYAMLLVSTNAWVLPIQYLHRISQHPQVYYGGVR
jgi:hypothetical protein